MTVTARQVWRLRDGACTGNALDEIAPFKKANRLTFPVVSSHFVDLAGEHPISVKPADQALGYRGARSERHSASHGPLPMQHDHQELGASIVLAMPLNRLGSDSLKDRWIVAWA
jgi:hypothetical protein